MKLNLNRLYYFHVFEQFLTVDAAARKLCISQPALSAQLKLLEEELRLSLFKRVGRKLELTEQAKQLHAYTSKLFDVADELQTAIENKFKLAQITLNLGVCDQVEKPFCVRMIGSFLKNYQKPALPPSVTLRASNHTLLAQQIFEKKLDMAISNKPIFHDDIEVVGRLDMPVFLVSKNKPKFSKKDNISSVLKANPMALPTQGSRLRTEIDSFLEKQKITPRNIFESDTPAAVSRAVFDGVGLSFLPYPYIKHRMDNKKVSIIGPKDGYWTHSIWLMARRAPHMQSIYENFTKALNKIQLENKLLGVSTMLAEIVPEIALAFY